MVTRHRLLRILDQHPRWQSLIGYFLIAASVVTVMIVADWLGWIVTPIACVLAAGGMMALDRASSHGQRRAERARRTAEIERELEL